MGLRSWLRRVGGGREDRDGPPDADSERRHNGRVDRFGWARYSAGEVAGEGLVTNLSLTGVRVERCTEPLSTGTKVELRLKLSGGYSTVTLQAEVVRKLPSGFALRFTGLSPEIRKELAEAMLATRDAGPEPQ